MPLVPENKALGMVDMDAQVIGVVIETCTAAHVTDWTALRGELWPDGCAEEHRAFAVAAIDKPARFPEGQCIAGQQERAP